MAITNTPNIELQVDDDSEYYNVDRVASNWGKIDAAVADATEMKVAGGTGTAITLDIPSVAAYKANQKFSFIASANNGGAATTINVSGKGARNLYKPNTTTAPTLIAGKAYDIWYNGTHFFLKASAEGTAIAANVLAGTTFSNDADAGIAGAMVDRGSVGTQNLTAEAQEYTIPAGYHNGLGKVKAVITGLIAAVIKAGTTVGGIVGTFTAEATATAAQILATKTAYVNGVKLTGTMPHRNNADTGGTYPDAVGQSFYDGMAYLKPSAGYFDGDVWVKSSVPNLTAANTKQGVTIGSIVGTYTGGGIESIQQGVIAMTPITQTTYTVNINTVDLARSVCFIVGGAFVRDRVSTCEVRFNSASQISIRRAVGVENAFSQRWCVIEFKNLKSFQTGRIQYGGAGFTTGSDEVGFYYDITINAVNPAKTLGYVSSSANGTSTTGAINAMVSRARAESATILRCYRQNMMDATDYLTWFAVEFY